MRDRPLESAHMPYEPATNQASRIWNPSQPFLTRMWAYLFSLVICPVVSSTASVLQHGMEVVRGKVSKPAKGPGSPPRAAPLAPDAAVPVLPPEERPRPAETPRRSVKLPDGLGRYFEEVQYPAVASTSGSAPNAKARPERPRSAPTWFRSTNSINQRRFAADVNRDNRRIAERLASIAKEPPATFHAPRGHRSLREGKPEGAGARRMGELKVLRDPDWPPVPAKARPESARHRVAEQRRREERMRAPENQRMRDKILRPYSGRCGHVGFAERVGGAALDTAGVWGRRVQLYGGGGKRGGQGCGCGKQGGCGEKGECRGSNPEPEECGPHEGVREAALETSAASDLLLMSSPEPADRRAARAAAPPANGVPRCMAVAQCAGCGRRSFWRGDGARLRPCDKCHRTFYCSEACSLLDWELHRADCRFYSRGIRPSRGAEERWVTNAALVRARRLLRKGTMSPEQVYLKYREWREEEVRGEEAAVRAVRDDAWGMADAERPCCMDGAAPRVADPNLPSHRGQGGRVFFARAGNRVLSARLSMRGREVVDRTYGVARGIVPGLEAP